MKYRDHPVSTLKQNERLTPKSVADTTSDRDEMQTVFYKYFTICLQINASTLPEQATLI